MIQIQLNIDADDLYTLTLTNLLLKCLNENKRNTNHADVSASHATVRFKTRSFDRSFGLLG